MKLSVNHLLIVGFLVAACSPDAEIAMQAPPTGEPASPERELWTFGTNHVGPFNADTHFDAYEIAALVPEYEVATSTRSCEGEDFDTLILTRTGAETPAIELVTGLEPGTIEEIMVFEADRLDGLQADIDDLFGSTGFIPSDCWPGVEQWSGMVVCYTRDNPQFGYWFSVDDYSGPDGELPPADVLQKKCQCCDAALVEWRGE